MKKKVESFKDLDLYRLTDRVTISSTFTGYADVNAIMGAVNEGAVYKFITKPWNDEDLRLTVSLALELICERDSLLQQVKAQDAFLQDLEKEFPGISKIERDEDGYIVIDY